MKFTWPRVRAAACGILLLLVWSGALPAAPAGAAPASAPGRAAIASAHPLATAAGLEILRAGGNAFDAAVAVSAALAVVEPTGSGLSGGGIYLLHRQSNGVEVAIDAREFAPAAATRDMYLDAQGHPVPGLSTESALAAGIPGEPAGLALLATRYGRLPVARTLAPAIHLARAGFPLSAHLHDGLAAKLEQFKSEPDVAQNFLRQGAVPPIGTIVRQPQLAATLEYLAQHGFESFTAVSWRRSWSPACVRRAVYGPRPILPPTARSNVRPWLASTVARAWSRPRRPARAASDWSRR